eukprot:2534921-Rhodomonas_salina.1
MSKTPGRERNRITREGQKAVATREGVEMREAAWQLVGVADVRLARVPSSSATVRDLKTVIEKEIHIDAKWLRVMYAGEELDAGSFLPSESDARDEAQNIFMVCLVLPDFALLCAQPWFTRRSRTRVRNQHAVRALAWQPGLLTHEEDQLLPEEAISKSFPVFIRGIPGLPSEFLRLDLRSTTPTVGQLRSKLQEILPKDSSETLHYETRVLQNSRQYLHRLNISSGAVVRCCLPEDVATHNGSREVERNSLHEGEASACHNNDGACDVPITTGSPSASEDEESEGEESVVISTVDSAQAAPAFLEEAGKERDRGQ